MQVRSHSLSRPGRWSQWLAVAAFLVGCDADGGVEDVERDVGDADYCEPVGLWPEDVSELEDNLLPRINRARAEDGTCGEGDDATGHPPGLPLALDPTLRCAARVHAGTLARSGSLSHEDPDGHGVLVRTKLAGYGGITRHQVLASGFLRASEVIDAWLESPTHCRAVLDGDISEAGVGIARDPDEGVPFFVVVTGEPAP